MVVGQAINNVRKMVESTGKIFLSVKFPREFELYFCSLELCSFEGELIDFFSFPIMPNSITKKEPYVSNIKKTFAGITVIKSSQFIPQELILRGSFGRSFKILGGLELLEFHGAGKYSDSSENSNNFSNVVKTGYGATKYLQNILEKSKQFDGDSKMPRVLYFHNSTLGESYIVEPMQVQFEQNLGSNMIWAYTLNFTITQSVDYGKVGSLSNLNKNKPTKERRALEVSALSSAFGQVSETQSNIRASLLRRVIK